MGKDVTPPSVKRSFYNEFSSFWFQTSLIKRHFKPSPQETQNQTAQKPAGLSDHHGFKPHVGVASLGQR